ncbi:hypothetical protein [Geodermatophilus chilensis]|jgi:hypothetical protein|uniref:hypothetical protein n=1 Tax=Geodermatophilus chilensis TaxID=2035835 RepID=UPI0012FFD598|nr:hypothetical protein [Geodermatophilus chilensis]
MIQNLSIRVPRRGPSVRLRTSVAGAVALLSLGLAGCGEPDDNGGGGGYLAQQLTGQAPAPGNH